MAYGPDDTRVHDAIAAIRAIERLRDHVQALTHELHHLRIEFVLKCKTVESLRERAERAEAELARLTCTQLDQQK